MRKEQPFFERESYRPNHWLDSLMEKLHVHSDAALARALDVPPSTISKVRNKHMPINSTLLLTAHEVTELSIRELRELMGDVHVRYWQGEIRSRGGRHIFSEQGMDVLAEHRRHTNSAPLAGRW